MLPTPTLHFVCICSFACSKIELTNQHGEAMSIPAEDSVALMEGMMLHRSALACVALTRQSVAPALAKKKQFPMTAAAEEKKEKEFLNNASPLESGTDPESGAQHGHEESKGSTPENGDQDGDQEERKGNDNGNNAQRGDGASSGSLEKVDPKKKGKGKGKMKLGESCRVLASVAGLRVEHFHTRVVIGGKGLLRQSRVLRSPGRHTPIARTFPFALASIFVAIVSIPPSCLFCSEL